MNFGPAETDGGSWWGRNATAISFLGSTVSDPGQVDISCKATCHASCHAKPPVMTHACKATSYDPCHAKPLVILLVM